ncbi:TrkH family potassium uptake protein [Neotabrizicola shimadae]|uniref:Trk system potassium uptake protein n=1 Tax=Neotabrizicola shimadae TaxID=2807096 RepID=A0A8G1EA96_9RHOB|nr:TrkH family potassium uptake protein [Neotabrizicola shimadae]QYZ68395.1 TrkH family potassium uptake protein [Neotabrizicola shimadae]
MMDLRPIVYIVGRILAVLAILMLAPALIDWRLDNGNAGAFLQSAIIAGAAGVTLSLATGNAVGPSLDVRQAYILTVLIWGGVPLFAAIPFAIGAPGLDFSNAYFEAVSGITTTGATVIVGLDDLPAGMNLWRGMLNWMGGLGIAFVVMIFLPVMRVGGMQFFRTEGFDTFGKVLPRATDIARQLLYVYALLTLACVLTYAALGMSALDAVVNGLASIATGGFSPADSSFTKYPGLPEYAGTFFMLAGSLPYIRYVQLVNGSAVPLWRDLQARAYLRWYVSAVLVVAIWRLATSDMGIEPAFRETAFNLASIMSGTGFFSGSFGAWGGLSMVVAFVLGVIGGCSGSSSGALSVFRVQVLASSLASQIQRIAAPSMVAQVKYAGRKVEDDVMSGLMTYGTAYILTIGLMSALMTLAGVDLVSSIFAIWTSIGNIGYGYGPMLAPTGTFVDFPVAAKWIMIVTMLMGRLGLLAFFVIALPRFWRR